jgi:hypothetical protein
MKTIVLCFSLFLLLATVGLGDLAAKNPLTEKQALDHLISRIQNDKLYDSWTTLSCLSIFIEEKTEKHFDITIREKHEGKCPGDPLTAPIVDRFNVNRLTGKILWYDWDGDLRPYKALIKWKKESKKSR